MHKITLFTTVIFLYFNSLLFAKAGFAEREHNLCNNFVLSNSDSYTYDSVMEWVLVLKKNDFEKVYFGNVDKAECLENFIIGKFNPTEIKNKFFLFNKINGETEKFTSADKFNKRLKDLNILPFYISQNLDDDSSVIEKLQKFRMMKKIAIIIVVIIIIVFFFKRKLFK